MAEDWRTPKPSLILTCENGANLYLAAWRDASRQAWLDECKITAALTIAETDLPAAIVQRLEAHRYLAVNDHPSAKLPFGDSAGWIHEQLSAGNHVVVHCMAGISRSPSLIAQYLMTYRDMSLDQALKYIRERRPCIYPNPGFMQQLKAEQERLDGTRKLRAVNKKLAASLDRYVALESDIIQAAADWMERDWSTRATPRR